MVSSERPPGDAGGIRDLAAVWRGAARTAESAAGKLDSARSDIAGGALQMKGDFSAKVVEGVADLPEQLRKLATGYTGCATALETYAGVLQQTQSTWDREAAAFDVEVRNRDAAAGELDGLFRPWHLTPDPVAAYTAKRQAAEAVASVTGIDTSGGGQDLTAQIRAAWGRYTRAKSEAETRDRLAAEARALRDDAERTCAREIDAALEGSGIKNAAWYEKVGTWFTETFTDWDRFVEFCGTVGAVLAVVALFATGPLALVVGAVALAVMAVQIADKVAKFARGEITLEQAALGVLVAVGEKFGGRLLGAAFKAYQRSGLSKVVSAGLRKGIDATTSAARKTGTALAAQASRVKNAAVDFARRVRCGDPVDVATGEMVDLDTDFTVDGVFGFSFERVYHSGGGDLAGVFGRGCWSWLDSRVEVSGDACHVWWAQGRIVETPVPAPEGAPVTATAGARVQVWRDGVTVWVDDPVTDLRGRFVPHPERLDTWLLQALVHPTGREVVISRDADGAPTTLLLPSGAEVSITTAPAPASSWAAFGSGVPVLVQDLTVEDAPLVVLSYDDDARLLRRTRPFAGDISYSWDDAHRITGWVDANSQWYSYTYETGTGRVVRAEGAGDLLTGSFSYSSPAEQAGAGEAVTVFTDAEGNSTTYRITARGLVGEITDADGATTRYTWDERDRLVATIDPDGRTTTTEYDERGDVVASVAPDGGTTRVERDGSGRPAAVTAPGGRTWRYTWADAHLTSVTDPAGATTTYRYDRATGGLVAVVDPVGARTVIASDAAGLPSTVTDPLGATWSVRRDWAGRPVAVTDPTGATSTWVWTITGKLLSFTDPTGARTTYEYDAEGNQTVVTDPVGGVTRTDYGPLDLPLSSADPTGARLAVERDTAARITAVTNPVGLVWRYGYTPGGLLAQETDYDGRTTRYTTTPAGELTEVTKPAGDVVTYIRDDAGRPTVVVATTADGSRTEHREHRYTPAGDLAEVSTRITDAAGKVLGSTRLEYRYDAAGRVVGEALRSVDEPGEELSAAAGSAEVERRFDAAGRLIGVDGPTGWTATRNANGEVTSLVLTATGEQIDLEYDQRGLLTRQTWGRVVTECGYDPAGRIATAITTTVPGGPASNTPDGLALRRPPQDQEIRRSWEYRPDGTPTMIDDNIRGTIRFTLDVLGRITTSTQVGGLTESYSYDPAGRITTAAARASDVPGPGTTGRPAEVPAPDSWGDRSYRGTTIRTAGRTHYDYDAAGRTIAKTTRTLSGKVRRWSYTWDALDQLIAVTTPDGDRWTYTYDPWSRRTAKTRRDDAGQVLERVEFAWDGDLLVQERATAGPSTGLTRSWHYHPDTGRLLAQISRTSEDGSSTRMVLTDQIGTPTHIVDNTANAIWVHRGTTWNITPLTDTITNHIEYCPIRHPGQYHDTESELEYNRYRYYDSYTSLYLNTDPLGQLPNPQNPRLYPRCPQKTTDPLGLQACTETYYRTMSADDFIELQKTSRIPATKETFISTSRDYVEKYDGVVVQLNVRKGTLKELQKIGARDSSNEMKSVFPNLPVVSAGWTSIRAYFKMEKGAMNIGLGRGDALRIFNDRLVSFERLERLK